MRSSEFYNRLEIYHDRLRDFSLELTQDHELARHLYREATFQAARLSRGYRQQSSFYDWLRGIFVHTLESHLFQAEPVTDEVEKSLFVGSSLRPLSPYLPQRA
ncbi:MAG: hypothetical protein AAFV95_16200 [Bacteroidota bacterium]